ncbi:hypothetical protein ACJX0J_012351 [Zea mays]
MVSTTCLGTFIGHIVGDALEKRCHYFVGIFYLIILQHICHFFFMFALLQLMQSTMGTNHVNEGKLYPYERATCHRMIQRITFVPKTWKRDHKLLPRHGQLRFSQIVETLIRLYISLECSITLHIKRGVTLSIITQKMFLFPTTPILLFSTLRATIVQHHNFTQYHHGNSKAVVDFSSYNPIDLENYNPIDLHNASKEMRMQINALMWGLGKILHNVYLCVQINL